MASFRQRGRRFPGGAVAILAVALGACTPVMTTRYREVQLAGWEGAPGETVRFELTDGSNVDMRDGHVRVRLEDQMARGQTASGNPAQVDLRDVRGVGIAFEERDEPATRIKYLLLGTFGYVGVLLAVALLASH